MLIENGVLRVRAGVTPVLVTVPLGATSRRGLFARPGEVERMGLYARAYPTEESRKEWLRVELDTMQWVAATELAHCLGRTDAKGAEVTAAHASAGLKHLYFAVRVFKNAANFEVALTLAWLPPGPGAALVIGTGAAAARRIKHLAQRTEVTEALVLDPHRLVLTDPRYDDASPPWDNVLGAASARLGLVPAPDAPLVVLAERPPRRPGETGATVAIDFGTHETSVVTQREGQRDVTVQGPLSPWSFQVVAVDLHGAAWHAEMIAPPRAFEERSTVGNLVMPAALVERWSVLARRDAVGRKTTEAGIPSVLIPRASHPAGIHGHPFDALHDQLIGHRALSLISRSIERGPEDDAEAPVDAADADAKAPAKDTPKRDPLRSERVRDVFVEVDALEPAPKLQLGRTPEHAEEYLRGVFDELAAREIVRAGDGGLGAVGPILLSYPVAFLAQDRETLQRVAREALAGGSLRGLCDTPPDEPVTFLDEATAATLGVLYHRFGSLSLDRLLDAFQPLGFDPEGDTPRSVRILAFDCGGGTTDLVLLRLHEDGPRIVSEIEDFYGLPFAGVEITRRVCREIKRRLRGALSRDDAAKLRTRFADDDGATAGPRTEADRIRQRRTLGFFYFGEAVKLALSSPTPLDDAALRAALAARAQRYLPEFEVSRVLASIPNRAWLEECAAAVLAPALETAERWLSRPEAPVQMVLGSGRSSQLPGVHDRLRAACGRAPRPVLAQHFLTPRELAGQELGFGFLDLHAAQRGTARPDLSKFGVAIGLAHGYVLTTKTGEGRRLVVKPIDEHRRSRYLGVLRQEGRGVQFVMPEERLIVRGDGRAVEPEAVVWIDEQPFAVRAVLGQNFRGPRPVPSPAVGGAAVGVSAADATAPKGAESAAVGAVDPPIPFAQVRFTPTSLVERERLGITRVQVGFAQRTASELVLAGLRVERGGQWEEARAGEEGATVLSAGGLTAHFEARRLEFDFRRNGVIDPEDIDRA
jgi:hypothetical protein